MSLVSALLVSGFWTCLLFVMGGFERVRDEVMDITVDVWFFLATDYSVWRLGSRLAPPPCKIVSSINQVSVPSSLRSRLPRIEVKAPHLTSPGGPGKNVSTAEPSEQRA